MASTALGDVGGKRYRFILWAALKEPPHKKRRRLKEALNAKVDFP